MHASRMLWQPIIWSMAAMLRDSVVVVVAAAVVRTRPRAIPLAMITMRKTTHGFYEYGAPLGGPSGRRSSAINIVIIAIFTSRLGWMIAFTFVRAIFRGS